MGIGGGVYVKNEVSNDSENSDNVLSGTFYGIEKVCRVVVQCCPEVGTYPKILYIFANLYTLHANFGTTLNDNTASNF